MPALSCEIISYFLACFSAVIVFYLILEHFTLNRLQLAVVGVIGATSIMRVVSTTVRIVNGLPPEATPFHVVISLAGAIAVIAIWWYEVSERDILSK